MEKPNGEPQARPSERAAASWTDSEYKCIAAIIKRKTRQLIARAGIPASDQDDIEQDLAMYLWRIASAYDPQRGPLEAFVTTLVSHEGSKIVRRRRAKKRGNGSVTSLKKDAPVSDRSSDPLSHFTTELGADARTGHVRISVQAHSELSIDIEAITGSLPSEWQLMIRLRSIKPMAEVSRDMGIPRSTLNARMKKIRSRFESDGLKKYFNK